MNSMSYIGKIIELKEVPSADKLLEATVGCGPGGKWTGVVNKTSGLEKGSRCAVFLPDALLPDIPMFDFMRRHKFRVKQQVLRGCKSEILIMPYVGLRGEVGDSLDENLGITKYEKPIAPQLAGVAEGAFPTHIIPKTDEPNFQGVRGLVEALIGHPFYITEKADGSSGTVIRTQDSLRVCSRNLELKEGPGVAAWVLARKYKLLEILPVGWAIQFEIIGPKIQGNPMGLEELDMRVFNLYDTDVHKYLDYQVLQKFCDTHKLPTVTVTHWGPMFTREMADGLQMMAQGFYSNGKPREGIVVRPQAETKVGQLRLSFKVINLNYKEQE